MPERDLRISSAAYDRLAAAAAAEGVTVRAYLEGLAARIARVPGHRLRAAGPEADLRLVALGIDDPGGAGAARCPAG
ncbi:hypothetical protein [Streptomyces sp. AHA2]|uniref:hypothetical protein n=1 Tax=Streptomyces sp. AHA2 TaxID=3064526 RepID=UPI002FE06204